MRNAILALVASFSLIACAADASDGAPKTEENPAAAGSGTVSANESEGSSATGASSAKNPWVGTWSLGGTQSTTCGVATGSTQLNGIVVITPSGDGGVTIDTKYSDTCTLTWDPSADAATVEKNQVCTIAIDDVNVTVELTSGTMTLNGNTMTALLSGTTNNGCSFTQQETLSLM